MRDNLVCNVASAKATFDPMGNSVAGKPLELSKIVAACWTQCSCFDQSLDEGHLGRQLSSAKAIPERAWQVKAVFQQYSGSWTINPSFLKGDLGNKSVSATYSFLWVLWIIIFFLKFLKILIIFFNDQFFSWESYKIVSQDLYIFTH